MDKLIAALGINPTILAAQLFNFVVLVFLLYKVGYKPILKFVNERTAKIEEGLKNAEDATKAVQDAQAEQARVIEEARAEGRTIVASAREAAEKQATEVLEKNAAQVENMKKKAEADLQALRTQMLNEVRAEASGLVFSIAEKVLKEKVTSSEDKKIVEKYLEK
ncbi:MAG: F0F1 ATP synthase subunit B [Candidatus Kerfeldbacteria bacterium]|nr:F0F1 ATP synthase subunit B [Candidatus Kerfeldbacteria bacterium]